MGAHKELTVTIRVEEFLRGKDDFFTIAQIASALGETRNRVSAAVHHLRKVRVTDLVVEPDGTGWWFVLSECEDQRSMKVVERTPEARPRRLRTHKKGSQ